MLVNQQELETQGCLILVGLFFSGLVIGFAAGVYL
jgi:hypothetical protein